MIDLSIVIPVYNGAATIGSLVERLKALDLPPANEIVLVNDGSRDDSARVCQYIADTNDHVIFVDLARNFGEHNAVMAGYRASAGRFVINIDDDFQNPPEELLELYCHALAHPELDVIYTSFREKRHTWFRNFGSSLTNRMADVLLDKPKGLYLSSFRCVSRLIVDSVAEYGGPYPYIDGLILQRTQRIAVFRVEHNHRVSGSSTYTLRKLVRLWMSMFLNFSVMPLRLATIVGFLSFGVGFLTTIVVVTERLLYNTIPPGWTSLMAGLMIFSGLQLLILGLIGEYLGRLFMTTNRQPQYLVRSMTARAEPTDPTARAAPPTPQP